MRWTTGLTLFGIAARLAAGELVTRRCPVHGPEARELWLAQRAR